MSELYIDGGQSGPDYLDGRDLVVLGTDGAGRPRRLPGIARIRGASTAYRVDAKQAKGKAAARPTYSNLDTSGTFTIEWRVWTPSQRQIAESILLEIAPNRVYASSGAIAPQSISSVQIRHLDITHVVVERATGFEWDGQYDACSLTVRPWYPAEKSRARTKKPKAATTPPGVRNLVTEAANNKTNPAPVSQPNMCGPVQPTP